MEVENLDQGVLYNLRIRGYSRGGDGLASSPTIQFMLGADCRVLEGTMFFHHVSSILHAFRKTLKVSRNSNLLKIKFRSPVNSM